MTWEEEIDMWCELFPELTREEIEEIIEMENSLGGPADD